MTSLKRYRNAVSDSARWVDFPFRDGDIVISTPPKCGTTWTQTLTAMLVHDTTDFDRPLGNISPWLDMQTHPLPALLAELEGQRHRRIIKTHTPLDGLPFDNRVTYVCVGRDPRDVGLSFEHHMANLNWDAFIAARASAVGLADMQDFGPPPEPPSTDPAERFGQWAAGDPRVGMVTLPSILGHPQGFWDRREELNIELFHYADMLADLPGQLTRLADVLGIDVTPTRLAELAAAGTYASMKQRAGSLVPEAGTGLWHSERAFFHCGSNGQWRTVLAPDAVHRYEERVAELATPDLAWWAHHGWLQAPARQGAGALSGVPG